MLLVPCPNCGPRNASDFSFLGEIIARPDPEAAPSEWRTYLYLRDNASGWVKEQWYCRVGCRRFFALERHRERNVFRESDSPAYADVEGNRQ